MCNSAPVQPPSDELVDRRVLALLEAPPAADAAANDQDPSPPGQLDEMMDVDFGIFDSLTLASKSVPAKERHPEQDADMSLDDDADFEDEIDAALQELEASWERLDRADKPKAKMISARRSGVRRCHLAITAKTVEVPTKTYDGPRRSPTRAA